MPKKVDKAKAEAKKARKQEKIELKTSKRNKKELKEAGQEDIEKILSDLSVKEKKRSTVSIYICPQPSPRSNFSLTGLPNGEMIMFGGEFCDGQGTIVYNDLFRWNLEKNEWKAIESLNTPPPRCSHQAAYYKDKLYLFGGEYSTLDQFHHYRDFWALDLKTSSWTEIKACGDVPSARSGHRMIVWRGYLILFGGFYEAMREQRWFNDLYAYSFQDERWMQIVYKPHAQVPRPRSGVCMCLHTAEDVLCIFGGFSKEKDSGPGRSEGRIHEDMWMMNLRSLLTMAGGSSTGGRACIDPSKAVWQRMARKGHFPSARCGASMTIYKNKAVLFGGVHDNEGQQHSIVSKFYSDLFAFDLDRKRWYQLGVKQAKAALGGSKLKRTRNAAAKVECNDDDGNEDHSSNDDSELQEIDEENEVDVEDPGEHFDNGNFFGYIDDNGVVVYMDLESDIVIPAEEGLTAVVERSGAAPLTASVKAMRIASVAPQSIQVIAEDSVSAAPQTASAIAERCVIEELRTAIATTEGVASKSAHHLLPEILTKHTEADAEIITEIHNCSTNVFEDPKTSASDTRLASLLTATETHPTSSSLARFFLECSEPCPRINPSLIVRGNILYMYGGVTEVGDVEVTLDDCWSIDLSKRDQWRRVLQGVMHTLVWRGEDADATTEASEDAAREDFDDDGSEDDEDCSDEDSSDDGEEHGKKSNFLKAQREPESTTKLTPLRRQGGQGGRASVGVRAEMDSLRSQLDTTDLNRTPQLNETLRMFFGRTTDFWTQEAAAKWRQDCRDRGFEELLSEKELKREAFLLAEDRYTELLPLLSRLNELSQQQSQHEGNDSINNRTIARNASSSKQHS